MAQFSLDLANQTSSQWTTHRRRPSVLSRVRPKSAMVGGFHERPSFDLFANDFPPAPAVRPQTATLRQQFESDANENPWPNPWTPPYRECLNTTPLVTSPPPYKQRRQSHSSTLSSLFSPNIRGLARRMSHTLRRGSKPSKDNLRGENGRRLHSRSIDALGNVAQLQDKQEMGAKPSRGAGWFRSHRGSRGNQRTPTDFLTSPVQPIQRRPSTLSPIPGHGSEPPVLPDEWSGSAARASAAAQNEMLGVALTKDVRLVEYKITRDSESGIGIDMRDRSEVIEEKGVAMVRLGESGPCVSSRIES